MHPVLPAEGWPISAAFEHLPHLVGDFAVRAGKAAQLTIAAAPVAVSDPIISATLPAVVQALRNAVTHGIESPALRAAAGKPEEGAIRLVAAEEAGALVVEVHDDGAGAAMADLPDLAELRGLSIIQARLATVGGQLAINAEPGRGTTVRLTVPLPARAAPAPSRLAAVA